MSEADPGFWNRINSIPFQVSTAETARTVSPPVSLQTTTGAGIDYREAAEWMATYIMGRLPDHNTMTADEIAEYERQLQETVERVGSRIGKP